MTKLWPFKDANFWWSQKTLIPWKSELWRHLGPLLANRVFSSVYLGEEFPLEREGVNLREIHMDLFRRKNERRIQKSRFQKLVINAISGMTSLITKISKLGEAHKMLSVWLRNNDIEQLMVWKESQLIVHYVKVIWTLAESNKGVIRQSFFAITELTN